ncbi:Bloom syndrome protein -like protein [Caligus rogercresseyi]|uniref:Bloom syndrome protein -like protein n=1 Tax=Caligus rogercresseyi TaxID=217165 RepID=A0A7T8GRC9_CALRO|nr:Bloom syndrome protein -like protein [Caligus rogercresseyi]
MSPKWFLSSFNTQNLAYEVQPENPSKTAMLPFPWTATVKWLLSCLAPRVE